MILCKDNYVVYSDQNSQTIIKLKIDESLEAEEKKEGKVSVRCMSIEFLTPVRGIVMCGKYLINEDLESVQTGFIAVEIYLKEFKQMSYAIPLEDNRNMKMIFVRTMMPQKYDDNLMKESEYIVFCPDVSQGSPIYIQNKKNTEKII